MRLIGTALLGLSAALLMGCTFNDDAPTLPEDPIPDPDPEPRVACEPIHPDACEPPTDPALLGEPGFTNLCWETVRGSCRGEEIDPPDPWAPGQVWFYTGWRVISSDAELGELLERCSLNRNYYDPIEVGDIDFTSEVLVLAGYPAMPSDCGGAGSFSWIAEDDGSFAGRARFGAADCDAEVFPGPTQLRGAQVESPPLPLGDVRDCPLW